MFVLKKLQSPDGPVVETHLYRFKRDAMHAANEKTGPLRWVKVSRVCYDVLESIPGCSVESYKIHARKLSFRDACRIMQRAYQEILPADALIEDETGENSCGTGAKASSYIASHFIVWPSHKRYPKHWEVNESFVSWEC